MGRTLKSRKIVHSKRGKRYYNYLVAFSGSSTSMYAASNMRELADLLNRTRRPRVKYLFTGAPIARALKRADSYLSYALNKDLDYEWSGNTLLFTKGEQKLGQALARRLQTFRKQLKK